MNASAKPPIVIIGIGNPLRSDDGLGWAATELLSRDHDTRCDIHTVYQLTPELTQWMAAAECVIMIDACLEGEPGELCVRPLSPSAHYEIAGTHDITPEALAALAVAIYGHCPPVFIVTIAGVRFDIGDQLSPIVTQRLPLVRVVVHYLCSLVTILKKGANTYGKLEVSHRFKI